MGSENQMTLGIEDLPCANYGFERDPRGNMGHVCYLFGSRRAGWRYTGDRLAYKYCKVLGGRGCSRSPEGHGCSGALDVLELVKRESQVSVTHRFLRGRNKK